MKSSKYIVLAAAMILSASAAHAATVNITNCTAAPVTKVGSKTIINAPGDDVVIKCPLMALTNTDKVAITANSITVDGGSTGSITAPGKGTALELTAAAGITIDSADVIAANPNGKMNITAGGNINVTSSSHLEAGDIMKVLCTGAGCSINVTNSAIDGSQIFITADGDVTMSPTSSITTHSPRDLIVIVSNHGNVLLAGVGLGLGTSCCAQALATCANPNSPDCPYAQNGQICLPTLSALQGFCALDCDQSPNTIVQGIEGNIIISAPAGKIDVHGMLIHAGESITFTALTDVNMTGAAIDNCGPKTGVFSVTSATCQVGGATLLDDDPESAPTLNCTVSGVATLLGTCSSKH
jgi:hypothetical protein